MSVLVLDCDGVLADFVRGFMTKANGIYGTPIYGTLEQKSWDKFEGLTEEQVAWVWDEIKKDPEFWVNLKPLATRHEFDKIIVMQRAGHDIYFVTSRPGINTKRQTEQWLHYLGIAIPTVLVSSSKGEAAKVLGAHALLEDKAGNAVVTQYLSPKTVPYLIDRQYNRYDSSVVGSKVKRVKSVAEFLWRQVNA
jgi:5'(3')-deoxyribonucleotidase